MRKTVLAVAVIAIAVAIAIVAQSQIGEDAAADVEPVATSPADTLAPEPITGAADSTTMDRADSALAGAQSPLPSRPYLRDVPNMAADDPAVEQQTTGAAVLQRAATAYRGIRSLRANFVQKRDNPLLGSTTTSRGTLYQKRPDLFLMKFSEPAGDVIVSDGRYFWLYYPSADAKQVLRAPATAGGAGGVDLQAQFLGDPLRRFTHTDHGTETVNGRRTHVLTLVPRQNVGYQSLKVWIDAQDALVRKFILTENNGLVQEFTLSNLTVNPALGNDLFKFTPPPDAQVIENP